MLTPSDLVSLSYTSDLTDGGISYACRSLAYTYDRMGGSPVDRMRRIAAGVAVELAFRRYLGEQDVPFDVLGATPFTDPDHYDVSLGGHRCDLKSYLISRRRQIASIHQDPGLVLQAPALVPLDQFSAEGHKLDDIYLFAFLLGVVAASQEDAEHAQTAGQPAYLIHPLPDDWARPSGWIPLEKLVLKSECEQPITVELGGQDGERRFVTATLELPPKKRVLVEQSFYSLACIHAKRRPEARIGVHSPVREVVPGPGRGGAPYIIKPFDWGNLWIYGMDILLAGWLSREEFRRKAKVLNAGQPTFQYARTRTKNLAVPISELEPMAPLLDKVRTWEAEKSV